MSAEELLNNVPCGIISFSLEGTVRFANTNMLQLLQYDEEEIIGKNIESYFTLSTRIFYQTHLHPMLRLHGTVQEIFISLLAKNKDEVPVLMNAKKSDVAGEEVYVLSCMVVAERKKYEDEIVHARRTAEEALDKNEALIKAKEELETGKEELDKQLTELASRNKELVQLSDLVAHDLQEPVRKMSVFAGELLADESNKFSERSVSYFKAVIRSAVRMKDVLRSLQDYMYISSQTGSFELVDLHKVVINQLNIVSNLIPSVSCKTNIQQLPTVLGNPVQLDILFYQLLKNAFAFKHKDRPLEISISSSILQDNIFYSTKEKYKYIDYLAITVRDNGIGFDPKYNDLIFKILKKANSSGGLGVGLAICKRIVETHRGRISASGIPGKGATFKIMLPMQ